MKGSGFKITPVKILICQVFVFICLLMFPLNAQAFDASALYENKPVQSGEPLYYVVDDNSWVVSENGWHKCIYDHSDYESVIASVRQAMYNREKQYSTYFCVDKKASCDDIYKVFNIISRGVYQDKLSPFGGDYLEYMSRIELDGKSGRLAASDANDQYDFYRITVHIDNRTTKQEEEMVAAYLNNFNDIYIKNNEVISNADEDDKKYYIVKTIYNFLAKNTAYDTEVYQDKYDTGSERYRYSHTAYGALFGNTEGAYNPESFNIDEKINLGYQKDSQGLFRIYNRSQGRAVCDGYSLVFYYLCKLNGIDCRIVMGDYVNGRESDAHAWNMVYLKDYNDDDFIWYSVDVTFGCQKSKKISNVFTIIDYSYFLRGYENDAFSSQNHQQVFDEYQSNSVSKSDYEFEIASLDTEKLNTVITRRREENADKTFVDTGEYNLEDYLIISADGGCYKLDKDNEYNFIRSKGFTYYSTGYYYSCDFVDLAEGVEYTCKDKFIHDAGKYDFELLTIKGRSVQKKISVSPLYMGDWSNYDLDLTKYPERAYFNGSDILIGAEIYDNSRAQLENGRDYEIYCYLNGDQDKLNTNPHNPGDYTIRIAYKGNYSGYVEVPFYVLKADLSQLTPVEKMDVTYGADIKKSCASLRLGDVVLISGTDYKVDIVGSLNYGEKGKVVITGLSDSKYVQSGTYTQWDYIVSRQYNISSLFNNKYITNAKYKYTGKAIKPDDFKLSYIDSSSNKRIELKKGRDYIIKSYSDNVKAGTGKVTIVFSGNYTGTAVMKFYIEYGKLSISCSDMTYNGKTQYAKPTVKLGNAVLKKDVDYTVSAKAVYPGVYQGSIKGKGAFSKISGTFIYYIKPASLSKVKVSTTQSSINVSWAKQGSNCIYEVYVYDTSKKSWRRIAQTGNSSYKITSVYVRGKKTAVKPNTQYKIRVRAVLRGKVNSKAFEKCAAYKELNTRTLPKKLSAKVSRSGKNALKLTWKKDSTVSGYQVYCSTSSSFKSGVKCVTIHKNKNYAYTFKKLKKGKTYYLRVRSFKKVGKTTYYSAYSKALKIKL